MINAMNSASRLLQHKTTEHRQQVRGTKRLDNGNRKRAKATASERLSREREENGRCPCDSIAELKVKFSQSMNENLE